ncbi:Na(+)/H(+) antiporter subunit C [Gordonia soli]|uniref:Na(+)/H(+) antiporter subunit C n=1 Tax=Gordonia soli NBRC 108243 TaxID=1223545 RepID=M0QN15_9ACTN|nr:Na(+)/H(+) antiporter subunit C [Gordonia soli]GAC70055.1 Na(+)/H(+) antiporter subunit C [Gordonia soli NBRC 108243]
MSVNLGLLIVVGVMAATGVYLLMERSLVRMLFGLLLCGNAINLMIIIISGGMGNPPILGRESENRANDADPLAQAMVLTAIVITMGVAAFILALVYRLFVLNRDDDDLEDDPEDRKIREGSLKNAPDRDRSDDPLTGADTSAGDYFDDAGNPLTPEEFAERHREIIETDLMPTDSDVVDEMVDDVTDETTETADGSPRDPVNPAERHEVADLLVEEDADNQAAVDAAVGSGETPASDRDPENHDPVDPDPENRDREDPDPESHEHRDEDGGDPR